MIAALAFLVFGAVTFVVWLAIGGRWPIWAFVLMTLVAAIDQSHPGAFAPAPLTLSSISGD
jgi:hypothetical protein